MTDGAGQGAERRSLLRPDVVGAVVLGALIMSVGVVLASAEGASTLSGRLGGDFPAFYGAGSLVLDDGFDDLYDVEAQAAAQQELFPDGQGVLYFAYPPPVAAGYAGLASLGYTAAYAAHTALMALALVAAWWFVRPMLPARRPPTVALFAAAATFVPTFMAVTLGQNSAIVVLLVVASWRASRDGRPFLAGVALGLLLFKPQYAVPLIGLHFVRGRPRVVLGAMAVGSLWWVAGAVLVGRTWLADWIDQVADFTTLDAAANGANAVSVFGVLEHVFGVGSTPARVLGGTSVLLLIAVLVSVWWGRRDDDLALPMAVAAVGILLISPHAMFYDASLVLVTVAGIAAARRPWPDRLPRAGIIVVGAWAVGGLHGLKTQLGFTPVLVVVIGAFALSLASWWRAALIGRIDETLVTESGAPPMADAAGSIVIPAYDESGRIEATIVDALAWIDDRREAVEIIVVDDGSRDDTAARSLAVGDGRVRVLTLAENRGKGYAVRVGMLAARGRWRVFLDADGSTAPSEIDVLLAPDASVVIGSVAVADARLERSQPAPRASAGRFGNRIIQWLVLPGIQDSQRGCKVFDGTLADEVFAACVIDRWGFDVEVLARCRALGHEPVEIGVRWEHRPVGHVRPWHYVTTIGEVVRVRALVGRCSPVRPSVASPR